MNDGCIAARCEVCERMNENNLDGCALSIPFPPSALLFSLQHYQVLVELSIHSNYLMVKDTGI